MTDSSPYVFEDPRSRALLDRIARVAAKDIAVLVVGPTGSGKEAVARLLHQRSGRMGGPYVTAHCGAIPEDLFESAFFGHVRGAFSGAVSDHKGFLDQASGGTLFLDELGELPLVHQVKLLRALDGYPYRPVGGSRDRQADVRFIAATNRDLEAMTRDGRFRDDLYGRVSQIVLRVPPLGERPGDIRALARLYAERHRPGDDAFAQNILDATARLTAQPGAWPRGIRELQAFVARSDCFDIDETEQAMLLEWRRHGQQATSFVVRAAHTSEDRDKLAGLIQATLRSTGGRPMRAAARPAALALAEILLDSAPVAHGDIQKRLDIRDRRTLQSNLAPLIDSGLVRDDGARIAIFWPPVLLRFLHQRLGESDWVPLAPGAIPLARGGDRLRIEATSQLDIELRAFLVTHRGESREPCRPLANRKFIAAGQTRALELELDQEPGFEQILVHVTWPTSRGMRALESEPVPVGSPMPHVLHKERAAVVERAGPGWVEELLVHHL